jgi:hypothetical protein
VATPVSIRLAPSIDAKTTGFERTPIKNWHGRWERQQAEVKRRQEEADERERQEADAKRLQDEAAERERKRLHDELVMEEFFKIPAPRSIGEQLRLYARNRLRELGERL